MKLNTITTLTPIPVLLGLFVMTTPCPGGATVTENTASVTIATANYKISIEKNGFKYSFAKPDGTPIAAAHPSAGLRFGAFDGGEPAEARETKLVSHDADKITFAVTNANGAKAAVSIHVREDFAKFEITPEKLALPASAQAASQKLYRAVAARGQEAIAWVGDKNWADYSVECSLKYKHTVNASSASGLLFRFKDVNNYYHFRIRYNKVELLKKSNKTATVVGVLEKKYSPENTYHLKATINGGTIVCYVNGEQVIACTDPNPLPKGAAGVRTYYDTCDYGDFVVKSGEKTLLSSDFESGNDAGWTKLGGAFSVVEQAAAPKKQDAAFVIDAQLAPMSPVYGLGDHGGFGDSANVFGITDNDFHDTNNYRRFVSNFSVFPKQRFAQVLFEDGRKRVRINSDENTLGAANVEGVASLYYFFGDMETIYAGYQRARVAEGYREFKPKYEFFEVGYEAFGSLGWNTYQESVTKDLQEYLKRGYRLKWGVVGSGFWKGARNKETQGCTTSFGIWDDTREDGRNDKLPNPRYPDVSALKSFFKENGMKLFLGLRTNLKAPHTDGGNYKIENDGRFPAIALNRGFYINDGNGKPKPFTVSFPKGNVYLLNNKNPDAVNWFKDQADLWGVDGFKEDTMLQNGRQLYNDAKLNQFNAKLMESGYYVMVRNAAYSAPGEIIRLEDTKYGEDQDRTAINGLNYAASGAPNFYPDIVAGKYLPQTLDEDQKLYFVRNAMFAAVCPAMSMGHCPWKMKNADYEAAVKKAADWHAAFAPYIYSAAVDSFKTGYPHTMTPLHIAFPDDNITHALVNKTTRQYEWMLGPSMLVCPAYGNDYATVTARDVYLPAGTWIDYETGERFIGPRVLKNHNLPINKIPVFIGGKGIVVFRNFENEKLYAKVYPAAGEGSEYVFTHPDGKSETRITNKTRAWVEAGVVIKDASTGAPVKSVHDPRGGAYSFEITAGRDYLVESHD